VFNAERTHRFTVFRHWGDPEDYACGISMNPSGASEDMSDPTVDGMCRRAREYWDVGAYYQLNVLSIRGTYSDDLKRAGLVNLPENDEWMKSILLSGFATITAFVLFSLCFHENTTNSMEIVAQGQKRGMPKCAIESYAIEINQRSEFVAACEARANNR